MIGLSVGAAVRAAGPAVAAALPAGTFGRWPLRAVAIAAGDVAARRFGRPGITIIGITPGPGKEFPPAKQLAADGVATVGWVGAMAVLVAVADRLPVPRLVAGLALGGAVYVGEVQAQAAAARALARADEMRAAEVTPTS
jgi:hypothetical protein